MTRENMEWILIGIIYCELFLYLSVKRGENVLFLPLWFTAGLFCARHCKTLSAIKLSLAERLVAFQLIYRDISLNPLARWRINCDSFFVCGIYKWSTLHDKIITIKENKLNKLDTAPTLSTSHGANGTLKCFK